jgi:hypothetical protein
MVVDNLYSGNQSDMFLSGWHGSPQS